MAKLVQIRDVHDEVHATLKSRAVVSAQRNPARLEPSEVTVRRLRDHGES